MNRTTTWAVLGSVAINLLLSLVVALVFSVAPAVQAQELAPPSANGPPTPHGKTADHAKSDSYLIAVRMGWGPC